MNLIILKATLLFIGILVNSYPMTKLVQFPKGFEEIKLKSYILKDSVSNENPSDYLNTQFQIALSAWKPGISLPSGSYALYIVNPPNFELKVAEFEYNVNKHKDWVRIPNLEWVDISIDDLHSWALLLQGIKINTIGNTSLPSSARNWTYNILVKTKDLSLKCIGENGVTINFLAKLYPDRS